MTDPSTSNSANSPGPVDAHCEIRIVGNPAVLEALRKAALFAQWRARVYAEMPEEIRPKHWRRPENEGLRACTRLEASQ